MELQFTASLQILQLTPFKAWGQTIVCIAHKNKGKSNHTPQVTGQKLDFSLKFKFNNV